MKRSVWLCGIVVVAYLASYLVIRQTQAEVWERDQQTYVLFPSDWPSLWYAFRPLTYLDTAMTGMKFHIGPHR